MTYPRNKDVLELREREQPEDLLIEMLATSMDSKDRWMRQV